MNGGGQASGQARCMHAGRRLVRTDRPAGVTDATMHAGTLLARVVFAMTRLLVLVMALLLAARSTAAAGGCPGCHRGAPPGSAAVIAVERWQGSVHAGARVTCDRCHGGHPEATTREGAHAGMVSPSDPASPVHSTHVPETCGRCHDPQYQEFIRSRHYRVLQGAAPGEAPTCVTCHGAMHTEVLTPETVAAACARCHNTRDGVSPRIPQEAHATLDLIFYAKTTLEWSRDAVVHARALGREVGEAEQAMVTAEAAFHAAEAKWHSFRFDEILATVERAYAGAKAAKRAVDDAVVRGALEGR